MMASVVLDVTMVSWGNCCVCGIPIYGPESLYDVAQSKRGLRSFYCISGHSQHFVGKSDAEKLKEAQAELAAARELAARESRLKEAARADMRRTKKRVANGVCPCCNRTFQNLGAHMKTKHKDYVNQDIGAAKP